MPSLMQHISASSIGPPIMKNASLTPCAFRQRARISLPLSSAIWALLSDLARDAGNLSLKPETAHRSAPLGLVHRSADDFFGSQLFDITAAQVEPAGEYLLGVLAELRRRRQLGRLAIEAHRPGLALPIPVRVMHDLHDAALLEARVVLQFERVVHRAGRHPGGADDPHRLFL